MIIFYTFDPPNKNEKLIYDYFNYIDSVLMLRISIHSVLRELKDHVTAIYIYSNDTDTVKALLNLSCPRIIFRNMPIGISDEIANARTNDVNFDLPDNAGNSHFKLINGKYGIAHSRVFIFSQLFHEFGKDILYLDMDTGIKRNSGNDLMVKLNRKQIITDMVTADSIAEDIVRMYPVYSFGRLPKYIHKSAKRFSCGYLYMPYSSVNTKIAKSFTKIYLDLLSDLGFMDSHDENAIGLAFQIFSADINFLFDNPSNFKARLPLNYSAEFGDFPSIVHYSQQKGHIKHKENMNNWLGQWRSVLDNNNNDPEFELLDYTKLDSFDFIWGRFETI